MEKRCIEVGVGAKLVCRRRGGKFGGGARGDVQLLAWFNLSKKIAS